MPDLLILLILLAIVILMALAAFDDDDNDGDINLLDDEDDGRPSLRPALGECPGCGAGQHEYCSEDCTMLDPYTE